MIDWFPPISPPQDDTGGRAMLRWRTLVGLRQLARTIDAKDPNTRGHSERVARLVVSLADVLGWSARDAERLAEAALVHDVGKVGVPDEVLAKRGPLTPEEYALVRLHSNVGAAIVAVALDPEQVAWVEHHHERWDGSGYPLGLSGREIPAGAALLAVADAWDAMTTRPESGSLSRAEALEECFGESGGQFAPWAVTALPAALSRVERRGWPRAAAQRMPEPVEAGGAA
ncbi:MAG: HD-GYP domain-containing protein [Thermoleophilia bacterium]